MELFFKICAAALVCLILLLILDQQQKHIVILICVVVCCMIVSASAEFFQEIMRVIRYLQRIAGLDSSMLSVLLKSAGVALVCEITSMVCTEAGYGSLGKTLHFLGTAMILYFSIPLLESFLQLVSNLLGGL